MTPYRMFRDDRPEIVPPSPFSPRACRAKQHRFPILSRFTRWLRALFARVLPSASVVRRSGWHDGTSPNVSRLAPVTRDALRQRWQREGQRRHATVAMLSLLALDLLVLGAPASLVERCHCAAIDASRDACSAFALASTFSGTELAPSLVRTPSRRSPTYERLAKEGALALIEHLVAVKVANVEAEGEADPAIRDVHLAFARSESARVRLAARVIRFCIVDGGHDARYAAQEALLAEAKARQITLPREVVVRAMKLMAS
jgi:hypothetical protein